MRKRLIFGLLVAIAVPSHAAKRLSVAQLDRLLAADAAAHKQDAEIAKQIENLVLSQRIPPPEFAQLIARFAPGPQTSLALRLLADQSEFLESSVEPSTAPAAPDSATQARVLNAAREYVAKTLQRLPDFLSTRTVYRYDDTPHADKPGDWPTRNGLHLVATVHQQTSVSSDVGNQPGAQGSAAWQPGTGLLSGGEFGTTLGMVLADISQGEVSWSHWEQTSAGELAVFHYSVPASASHFEVFSAYRPEASTEAVRSEPNVRGISGVTLQQDVSSGDMQLVSAKPAYQGSIWVDPASGVVYRITMETDTRMGLRILRRAAILVEYGPVEIAGKTYICPLRSLAQADAVTTTQSRLESSPTQWLNEAIFSDYHRFGSSVRILSDEAKEPVTGTSPGNGQEAEASAGEAAAQSPTMNSPAPVAEKKATVTEQEQTIATAPASAPAGDAVPSGTKADRSESPAGPTPGSTASAAPPPDTVTSHPAQLTSSAPQESMATLQVNVNSLLVPAVVLDKNGDAVGDLTQADFAVTDNGKRRTITGFSLVRSAPIPTRAERESGAKSASAVNAADPAEESTESAPQKNRYLIFLFDDRNMNLADLQIVKKAAARLFERPLPEGEFADVLSLTGANSGITRDHAALQSAVMKLTVHQASQNVKENCPNVDYYHANQIIRFHNTEDFQLAVHNARQCTLVEVNSASTGDNYSGIDNPNDPYQQAAMRAADSALAVGDEEARESLLTVRNVLQATTKLPGERVLILVSPGFFALSEEALQLESEIIDIAAASDVTVNALDARGLNGAAIDASQGVTSLGQVTGQVVQDRMESMQESEGVLAEIAAGTGGQFFHDNNDLQGGLQKLAAAPQALYLLEISMSDIKANGSYHRLRVKVDRPGLEVLARKGYAAPQKSASKK